MIQAAVEGFGGLDIRVNPVASHGAPPTLLVEIRPKAFDDAVAITFSITRC